MGQFDAHGYCFGSGGGCQTSTTTVVRMSSTHSPLSWIDDALVDLDRAGLRRRLAVRGGSQSARVVLDGHELINFGSNDYLGLAADERVIEAARIASERAGWGGGARPLV